MTINLPIHYNQQDGRWKGILLGFNSNGYYSIGGFGCLITCLAMVARYYGKNDDPTTINSKLKAMGPGVGFVGGGGDYIYGGFHKIYGDIGEKLVNTPSPLSDGQFHEIKTSLDSGYPVMVQLDYDPKDADLDSHFVLVVGYNPTDENDLTIADPLTGGNRSLKDYLGWWRPSARKTIEKYIIYSGKVPKGTGTVAVPEDIYPNIIHKSTQWDKSSAQYMPDHRPEDTSFEDLQRVVNGYKSEATSAKNDLLKAKTDLAGANTQVANLEDKIANVESKCQREQELLKAEITALKSAQPNIDKLKKQYEGTISALENSLREAQKAGGQKDITINQLNAELEQCQAGIETLGAFERVVAWFKTLWTRPQ